MTKRLYYADSYLKNFSAEVVEKTGVAGSPAVILDQTAFYPESGGQPFDTGSLGEGRVIKVIEDDSGRILHLLDRDIPAGPVSGCIDWPRRFDHMQQHTGQHILSQAFIETAKAQTLSFHMGAEISTIDIDMAQPSAERMEKAQDLATEIVFQNRAVSIIAADRERLAELGIRKESTREGEIRVIDVDGFDRSACGGTHVGSTGEIGIIFILGFERYKGGTRAEFVAGGRALKRFCRDHELLKKLGKLYSSAPEDIPAAAEKLLEERTAMARENQHLCEQLLETEASELLKDSEKTGYGSVIRKVYTGRNLDTLKTLAQKVTVQPATLAILALADTCQIVVARSKDLSGSCNDAVKRAVAQAGGKGGGRPELAQAGGFSKETLETWVRALEEYFRQ